VESETQIPENRKERAQGVLCPVLFLLIAVFVMNLPLLTGCGSDKEKVRVGVSISGIAPPNSQVIEQAIKEKAEEYGAKIVYDREGLVDLLSKGIDVLILNRSSPGELEASVKGTHHASIPVVVLGCSAPQNLHVEACVKVNLFETGRIAADYVVKALGGKGNVIILEGPRHDETARQITLGMYSVLEQQDAIRIVADEQHPNWDEKLAADTVRFTLKKYAENIQAILAGNSQLAMGAVRAVAERGLVSKIITAGIGADLAACRAIIGNRHDVEVDRMSHGLGVEALSLAVAVAKDEDFAYDEEVGEGNPKIKVKYGPLRLITRENVSVMKSVWPQLIEQGR